MILDIDNLKMNLIAQPSRSWSDGAVIRNYTMARTFPIGKYVLTDLTKDLPYFILESNIKFANRAEENYLRHLRNEIVIARESTYVFKNKNQHIINVFVYGESKLTPIYIKERVYYVARGVILDDNYNPLICVMLNPSNGNLSQESAIFRYILIAKDSAISVLVNKKFITLDVPKEELGMYKWLQNELVAPLAKMPWKMVVQSEPNFWSTVHMDPTKSVEDLGEIYKPVCIDFIQNITKNLNIIDGVSPSVDFSQYL